MSRPSLTQIREATGITARRWVDCLPQLAELKSDGTIEKYDLTVEWGEVVSGVGSDGLTRYNVEGVIQSPTLKSQRCMIESKRKGHSFYYHFTFLPNVLANFVTGIPVYVNGEEIGKTAYSHTDGIYWQLEQGQLIQLRVELDKDSEWVKRIVREHSDLL